MRNKIPLFLLLCLPFAASAGENELVLLDQLIETTQQSLKEEMRLRDLVKQYQQLQKEYIDQGDDNDKLYQLIKTAYTVLEGIKSLHLEHSFEPEFLSELALLSKPATKSVAIPKP
jgi:hypothetical protein